MNAVRNFSLLNVVWSNTTQIVIKENLTCCSMVATNREDVFLLEFEHVPIILDHNFPNHEILHAGDIIGRIRSCSSGEAVTCKLFDESPNYFLNYAYQPHFATQSWKL